MYHSVLSHVDFNLIIPEVSLVTPPPPPPLRAYRSTQLSLRWVEAVL